jgi:hypothetical protein
MDSKERQRLRELCDKATPGPWEREVSQGRVGIPSGWEVYREDKGVWTDIAHTLCAGDACKCFEDASFIASARSAMPELLDALDEAEKERDAALHAVKLLQRGDSDGQEYAHVTLLRAELDEMKKERDAHIRAFDLLEKIVLEQPKEFCLSLYQVGLLIEQARNLVKP